MNIENIELWIIKLYYFENIALIKSSITVSYIRLYRKRKEERKERSSIRIFILYL